MANLKWLRAEARGRFTCAAAVGGGSAGRRPCALGVEKMATNFLQRKYYPTTVPAAVPLGDLQRIRLAKPLARKFPGICAPAPLLLCCTSITIRPVRGI